MLALGEFLTHEDQNMEVLTSGFFVYEGPPMPCLPSDLPQVVPYSLGGVLGHGSAEEAASRLLYVCQHQGRWIGVRFSVFTKALELEIAESNAVGLAVLARDEEARRYARERTVYDWLDQKTHGFYGRVAGRLEMSFGISWLVPVPPRDIKVPRVRLPPGAESHFVGIRYLSDGFTILERAGMVAVKDLVIFPRPLLAERVHSGRWAG